MRIFVLSFSGCQNDMRILSQFILLVILLEAGISNATENVIPSSTRSPAERGEKKQIVASVTDENSLSRSSLLPTASPETETAVRLPLEEIPEELAGWFRELNSPVLKQRNDAEEFICRNRELFQPVIREYAGDLTVDFWPEETVHRLERIQYRWKQDTIQQAIDSLTGIPTTWAGQKHVGKPGQPERWLAVCQMKFAWAPDIQVVRHAIPMEKLVCVDDQKRIWRPVSLKSAPELFLNSGESETLFSVNLRSNSPVSESDFPVRFEEIQVWGNVLAGINFQTFRFPLPAPLPSGVEFSESQVLEKTSDDLTVSLLRIRRSEKKLFLTVQIRYKNVFDAFDSHRNWLSYQRFYLNLSSNLNSGEPGIRVPDNRKITPAALHPMNTQVNQLTFELVFDLPQPDDGDDEKPVEFVLELPTFFISREFPFRMESGQGER